MSKHFFYKLRLPLLQEGPPSVSGAFRSVYIVWWIFFLYLHRHRDEITLRREISLLDWKYGDLFEKNKLLLPLDL